MAFKMKGNPMQRNFGIGKSPATKKLVGKQENLPEGLKAKIEAAPGKMYGNVKTPVKQKGEKTYPEGYTEKDIKFLEEQSEDVVRYEDLDEKGKEIWRKQGKPVPNTKDLDNPTPGKMYGKMKSPAKQGLKAINKYNVKKLAKKDGAAAKGAQAAVRKGKKATKKESKYMLQSSTRKGVTKYFKVSGGKSNDGGKTFSPTEKTKISKAEYNSMKGDRGAPREKMGRVKSSTVKKSPSKMYGKKKAPSKFVQFIPAALGAVSSLMGKKKE